MPERVNPVSQRRMVRLKLRQYREARGMTQEHVAKTLAWSSSKVIRIESGISPVSLTDLQAMLQLYDVTDPARTDELLEAVRNAKDYSWWHYRFNVSREMSEYLSLESSASNICLFHPLLVPPLLQTAEYTQAIVDVQKIHREQGDDTIRLRLAHQQELMDQTNPPTINIVLLEEVLQRPVADATSMVKQLRHLEEALNYVSVSIRIIPIAIGANEGLFGPFAIITLSDEDELVFVSDNDGDAIRLVKSAGTSRLVVARYRQRFERLSNLSLSANETRLLIASYKEKYDE
jgi:transcriptional regulator with XRE-family HTH domain